MNRFDIGNNFEAEVRRVARALWSNAPGEGAPEMFEGRERDSIFELEDLTHYIECTTSTKRDKLIEDLKKLIDFRRRKESHGRLVKLWMITEKEPTADQRTYARENNVQLMSLAEFRRKVIDGNQYIQIRTNAPFGSAADPANESPDISKLRYQPTKIHEQGGDSLTADQVAEGLLRGDHFVLLGDFGMGKSLTIREIFSDIKNRFQKTSALPVPVALNLRDHWGQKDPAEALERHAKRIGFDKPVQLVRALHAGQLLLLLDGFDEIAPSPWNTRATPRLRELRRDAVSLVAEFVHITKGRAGLLVAGRSHFFDSRDEMVSALNMHSTVRLIEIGEFSEEESRSFLKHKGIQGDLPEWLPRRPLLLATLVARGLLDEVLGGHGGSDPALAWNELLDNVCRREARTQKPLDAEAIRRILERLAAIVRSTGDGYGPVTAEHIAEAFRKETGADPDDTARPLLNRLPGLTVLDSQRGTRRFMDAQMVDALRAGTVAHFLIDPYNEDPHARTWQHGLGAIGVALVAKKSTDVRPQDPLAFVLAGVNQAVHKWDSGTLALDLVQVARKIRSEDTHIDLGGLRLSGGDAACFDLSEGPLPTRLYLADCSIDELILTSDDITDLEIRSSVIRQIRGCTSEKHLPAWLAGCEVSNYDDFSTNAQVMDKSAIALGVRVLVTILRKLYVQKGHGREERALSRGVDQKARQLVRKLLPMLAQERLATPTTSENRVWYPVAGMRSRAIDIIRSPGVSADPIVLKAKSLDE